MSFDLGESKTEAPEASGDKWRGLKFLSCGGLQRDAATRMCQLHSLWFADDNTSSHVQVGNSDISNLVLLAQNYRQIYTDTSLRLVRFFCK